MERGDNAGNERENFRVTEEISSSERSESVFDSASAKKALAAEGPAERDFVSAPIRRHARREDRSPALCRCKCQRRYRSRRHAPLETGEPVLIGRRKSDCGNRGIVYS